jgi:hypothetical protein
MFTQHRIARIARSALARMCVDVRIAPSCARVRANCECAHACAHTRVPERVCVGLLKSLSGSASLSLKAPVSACARVRVCVRSCSGACVRVCFYWYAYMCRNARRPVCLCGTGHAHTRLRMEWNMHLCMRMHTGIHMHTCMRMHTGVRILTDDRGRPGVDMLRCECVCSRSIASHASRAVRSRACAWTCASHPRVHGCVRIANARMRARTLESRNAYAWACSSRCRGLRA